LASSDLTTHSGSCSGPSGDFNPVKPDKAQTPAEAEHDLLENEKLKRELAKTPETDPTLAQAVKGLGIDEWLGNVKQARELIKGGWATGTRGWLGGHAPWGGTDRNDFLGTLQGIQGATILEKLSALREQSKNGSSGMGSLTEQEGERLANSIAALNPNMSGDQLLKNLDIIEHHAGRFRQLARARIRPIRLSRRSMASASSRNQT
jgi:hypothetical protein